MGADAFVPVYLGYDGGDVVYLSPIVWQLLEDHYMLDVLLHNVNMYTCHLLQPPSPCSWDMHWQGLFDSFVTNPVMPNMTLAGVSMFHLKLEQEGLMLR
eukprot:scaffold4346_cov52-Attheya_sp.AAC.4